MASFTPGTSLGERQACNAVHATCASHMLVVSFDGGVCVFFALKCGAYWIPEKCVCIMTQQPASPLPQDFSNLCRLRTLTFIPTSVCTFQGLLHKETLLMASPKMLLPPSAHVPELGAPLSTHHQMQFLQQLLQQQQQQTQVAVAQVVIPSAVGEMAVARTRARSTAI